MCLYILSRQIFQVSMLFPNIFPKLSKDLHSIDTVDMVSLWSLRRWWCHHRPHCPGPCWCRPGSGPPDEPGRNKWGSEYRLAKSWTFVLNISHGPINLLVFFRRQWHSCGTLVPHSSKSASLQATMLSFFITVAPSLVMVVPLPSSINLSIPRGPKVLFTMLTTLGVFAKLRGSSNKKIYQFSPDGHLTIKKHLTIFHQANILGQASCASG